MWDINDNLWFDAAVVFAIFAVGNICFGHFEEHRPKWKRLLKVVIVVTVVLVVSASLGRIWAYGILAIPLVAALLIHLWWLPRNGVHGWTGEPKERYYELIKYKPPTDAQE